MMKSNLQNWILTGAVFAVSSAFAVFCGISISNLTAAGSPVSDVQAESGENDTSGDSVDDETEPDDANAPADADSGTEEDTAATEEVYATQGGFHALSSDELAAIENTYDGSTIYYYTQTEMGESGLPTSVEHFKELLSGFDHVVITGPDSNASLIFSLVTEYDDNITGQILDILAENGVKATFFASKVYAENNPEIISRILNEGHELGSMGASVPDGGLASYGLEDQMNDIVAFHEYMLNSYGYEMTKYYPSYEVISMQNVALVTQMGYEYVLFGASYEDYDHSAEIDTEATLQNLIMMLHNGVIYCFHTTNAACTTIVPQLISYVRSIGFTLDPVQ